MKAGKLSKPKDSLWEYLIGVENYAGKRFTKSMLTKWSKSPVAQLECVFCGTRLPKKSEFCPYCDEYRGLQPYIPKWSD